MAETVVITALFLVGAVLLVPGGLRLVPSPTGRRSAVALRAAAALSFPAGLMLAVAFALPAGPVAGLLAGPWLAVTGLSALAAVLDAVDAAHDRGVVRPGLRHAMWAALAFLPVAGSNALADRLGIQLLGFAPSIVLLTAVHFTFAGFVLVLVGTLAHVAGGGLPAAIGVAAIIVGIPVTAIGFFGIELAALVGALLVAGGGLAVGATLLRLPHTDGAAAVKWLRRLAGTSLLVSMPLAAVYAIGTFLGTSWMDLPTMARTHGALNALGFALPAVLALTLERVAVDERHGPARTLDVLRFNVGAFLLAPLAALLALFVALTPLPLLLRAVLAAGALGALLLTTTAIAATWWVYEHRAGERWRWVVEQAGQPRRWLNLTTGFDDSSALLRARLAGAGRSVDVVDPALELDRPLLRARRRFPPAGDPVVPAALATTLEPDGADVVFLLMAAHETHGRSRRNLLRSAARAAAPGGRVILIEHLRDIANIAAFGPGAWHFSSREEWLTSTVDAGLELEVETRLSPFVAGFVFRPGTQP